MMNMMTDILSGMNSSGMVFNSGGVITVESGGSVTSTTMNAGAEEIVYGSAMSSIVSGGAEYVSAQGVEAGAMIDAGGFLSVASGGMVAGASIIGNASAMVQGMISGTTINGGSAMIYAGGSAIDTFIGGVGTSFGTEVVSGAAAVGMIGSNGIEMVAAGGSEFGTTVMGANGQLNIGGGGAMLAVTVDAGMATVSSGGSATSTTVSGGILMVDDGALVGDTHLLSGGAMVLAGLAYMSGSSTVLLDSAKDMLTVMEGGTSAMVQLIGNYSGEYVHAGAYISGGTAITVDGVPCYCRGTRIRTDAGEVAVEDLSIGDRLINHQGEARPIRWIGRRAYDGRFIVGDRNLLPICFQAGSLGSGMPRRDLYVSPLHAMFIDGMLIPAWALVNGVSIRQVDAVDRVEYFHVELATHDVIWAEGAAAESFLDTGSRCMFQNAAEYRAMFPDEVPVHRGFCAPLVDAGAELMPVRRRLAALAAELRLEHPVVPKAPPLSQVSSLCIPPGCRALPLAPMWEQTWITGAVLDGARLNLADPWLDSAFDLVELTTYGEARRTKPDAVLRVAPATHERWLHLEAPEEGENLVRWGTASLTVPPNPAC